MIFFIFAGTFARQLSLREQWYFSCRCSRCQDVSECSTNANSLKCPTCKSELLPKSHLDTSSDWICHNGHVFSVKDVINMEERVMMEWTLIDQGNFEQVENFITDTVSQSMSDFHHFVMKLKCHYALLIDVSSSTREVLFKKLRTCQEIVKYLSQIDPGKTKKMGLFLMELNLTRLHLAKLDQKEHKITKLEFLLRIKEGAKVERMANEMLRKC